ncbi:hypothetical protein EXIGLDRAFT_705697 [Exidia glandulosa HHB12029]|uniref:Uncharacterized protein n=1 Tax=Exidia glandulosa HHB12029 TaxID=1314781 RepID=A0A165BAG1_EXIGL|nr:hypothetical protein EXIGLDRAFT_705697 [Exidia glandulosa HHB12029]
MCASTTSPRHELISDFSQTSKQGETLGTRRIVFTSSLRDSREITIPQYCESKNSYIGSNSPTRTISLAVVCPASRCDGPSRHTYAVRHRRNWRCVELEIDGKGRPSIQLAVGHRGCDQFESRSMEESNGPRVAPGCAGESAARDSGRRAQAASTD